MTDSPVVRGILAGRYRIEREIGRGGMATVYLASDLRHDSPVAVKVLREEIASVVGGDRFAREIHVTASLQHPNIVGVFDSGFFDGVPFYVMPYIEGETLDQRIAREGPLPIEDAVRISGEIADALQYAHASGLVHRDVKPGNILLFHGRAMLSDFGIARVADVASNTRLTETGLALGTAHYMSPEQATAANVDGRSDIYSLACVLYEMLAGSPPFAGSSARSVIARHALDEVPALRTVRETIPPALERAILTSLAKLPVDRHKDAAEFKAAILRSSTEDVPRRTTMWRRVAGFAASAVVIVLAYAAQGLLPSAAALNANRVMVFPLLVTSASLPATIGEDVGSMIGNRLDETGGLRWIDAWPLLDSNSRDSIRTLTDSRMLELARERGCRFYVVGRITSTRPEELGVFLYLRDALDDGDGDYAKGQHEGPANDVLQTSLTAVNQLLPTLLGGRPPDIGSDWLNRDPAAVASFLRAESAFRRVQVGEALVQYRDAIRRDSTFALAAIRGAQAATWNHRPGEAADFIAVASRQPLPLRYAHFARGYEHYLAGAADSAAAEFRSAIDIDREMIAAWMQLGETYTHLLIRSGSPDSLAAGAFQEARRLDPEASNAIFHLVEIGSRRRDPGTRTLADAFLASKPDSVLATQIRIMQACSSGPPSRAEWTALSVASPFPLLTAAIGLDGGGARVDCAESAYNALLANDTAASGEAGGRRWAAIGALSGLLVATGRANVAIDSIDAFVARYNFGSTLVLLGAPWIDAFADRAREMLHADAAQFGPDFGGTDSTTRLWELGVFAASERDTGAGRAIAAELHRRASASGASRTRLMARSVDAWTRLASGDTAGAFVAFDALVPAAVPGDELAWDEATPLGGERLMLATLLAARGEHRRAIAIADVLDSPKPVYYGLLLRKSLELRVASAAAIGDGSSESAYRERLAALDRAGSASQ